jgi:hypothetical protein
MTQKKMPVLWFEAKVQKEGTDMPAAWPHARSSRILGGAKEGPKILLSHHFLPLLGACEKNSGSGKQ